MARKTAEPEALSLKKSAKAFARAQALMPGGVNSPVRAYQAVGGHPVFVKAGKGARVTDIDGNTFIDYVSSYGPLILGHAPDAVMAALTKATKSGTSFGMPTEAENKLAKMIISAVPSIEKVRFVNSGTEAAMSAIRLARAATGRNKVVKCIGCYHGHSDGLLVQAGSGAATLGAPSSPGVPESIASETLLLPYNDLEAATKLFEEHGEQIACFAIEPIAGNMGCIPPAEGYLKGLRELCTKHGALLLFDEVMTGFRVALGGAQQRLKVTPDLTCLGKVIGGGLPCAAYGGSKELMSQVSPEGKMYQAGTLSGNPLAMAAGAATVEALQDQTLYEQLEAAGTRLAEGLAKSAAKAGVPVHVAHVGSMVSCFFCEGPIVNFDDASRSDTKRFARFFRKMLEQGVMLPPSQFETWFVSTAHDKETITATLNAAESAFNALSIEAS